jgi:WD40 repeat protein
VFDSRGLEIHRLPRISDETSKVLATASVGETVWVSTDDRNVYIYDRQTFEQRLKVAAPAPVTCLLTPSAAGRVWGGTTVGTIVIWSAATVTIEAVFSVSDAMKNKPVRFMTEHQGQILAAVGDQVFSFGAQTIKPIMAWPPHLGAVTAIASMPPNVWTSTTIGEVRCWDSPHTIVAGDPSQLKWESLRVLTGAISSLLPVPAAG